MSSARLRYFLASLGILLLASACDAPIRQEMATLNGHADYVYSVAFSPDGKTLASGSDHHTVKLWDAKSGAEMATLKGHDYGRRFDRGIWSVAFSPVGDQVSSGWYRSNQWRDCSRGPRSMCVVAELRAVDVISSHQFEEEIGAASSENGLFIAKMEFSVWTGSGYLVNLIRCAALQLHDLY
jgi:WD40 repeat protein